MITKAVIAIPNKSSIRTPRATAIAVMIVVASCVVSLALRVGVAPGMASLTMKMAVAPGMVPLALVTPGKVSRAVVMDVAPLVESLGFVAACVALLALSMVVCGMVSLDSEVCLPSTSEVDGGVAIVFEH